MDNVIEFDFERLKANIENNAYYERFGKVSEVIGLIVRVEGLECFVGEVCEIIIKSSQKKVLAEVVGFKEQSLLVMPLDDVQGIGPGCIVKPTGDSLKINITDDILGKTLDGLGRPIDGSVLERDKMIDVERTPPNPFERKRISEVMSTGVKSIDGFLTCGEGQRIGIFAGSGVGKSTLLGMISRYSGADVNVIALVGERGREVLEFIEKDLGDEGYKKSVVIVATSDQPPLVRLKAAFVATAVAEHFRDKGKKVMLMMDSVTRFAMAQREIGLATGEPPTTRGYTPSVFAMLPKLLERSGMSKDGSITAFYTVLVEGDDMNEPIADAVRGILDGHIVLSRKIAAKNHFPAIDIQNSISRIMKQVVDKDHFLKAGLLKENLSIYAESEDLINIGAYKKGTNPIIDRSIDLIGPINNFLRQDTEASYNFDESINILKDIIRD